MKYVSNNICFKALLTVACMAAFNMAAIGADLSFTGSRVITISPESSTGLDKIYVIENLNGTTASYPSTTAKWSEWNDSGAAYSKPLTTSTDGNGSSHTFSSTNGCGITIEDAGRMHHFWIVNYDAYRVDFSDLSVKEGDSDCQSMYLNVATASANNNYTIKYFSINGVPRTLDRGYELSYNTLAIDEEAKVYNLVTKNVQLEAIKESIRVDKPLCDTNFTLKDDRFANEWGIGDTAVSETYITDAIEAYTYAEKHEKEHDNEQTDQSTGLGGSAPIDITFVAAVTDAVKFTEWQLSTSPDFDTYELRFNQTEIDYTFTEYGTWYMRFQASNADGTCDWFSPTYEIQIGESKLVCPNAFSPGASEGVNDEWKVSYKSIVDFECHIFNRWGIKMATLNHPSQGWDGKYNDKLVPSGVYYYVIKARGADGREYDMSGDINIIRYNNTGGTQSDDTSK